MLLTESCAQRSSKKTLESSVPYSIFPFFYSDLFPPPTLTATTSGLEMFQLSWKWFPLPSPCFQPSRWWGFFHIITHAYIGHRDTNERPWLCGSHTNTELKEHLCESGQIIQTFSKKKKRDALYLFVVAGHNSGWGLHFVTLLKMNWEVSSTFCQVSSTSCQVILVSTCWNKSASKLNLVTYFS